MRNWQICKVARLPIKIIASGFVLMIVDRWDIGGKKGRLAADVLGSS